jgi:hypothetical protein
MWQWFSDIRRKKILTTPFSSEWEGHIQNNIQYYQHLNNEEKKRLQDLIQIFIAEKSWLGCNGLELTDEIRVMIAAHACLMILALPNDYYRNVESIYVYPTTILPPEGIVNLTRVWQTGQHEKANTQLPTPSFSL